MSTQLTVRGMSCDGCESSVEDALEALDGVTAAHADNEADAVTIEGEVDLDQARAAVEEAGYEPEGA